MHLFKAVEFLMPKVFQNPVDHASSSPNFTVSHGGPRNHEKQTSKQLFNIANALHRILVFENSVLYMKCPQTFALSWREAYEI